MVFANMLGSYTFGVVTGALTFFVLVFGEVVPKAFAQTYSKSLALLCAPLLYVFYLLFQPLVWVLDLLVKGLLKLSGKDKTEMHVTEEELKAFVSIGAEEGAIEKDEQALIENVLEFSDTRAEEIMVPRVDIQALPIETPLKEVSTFMLETHHSRIPIYKGTIDNVVGVITVKDMLEYLMHGEAGKTLADLELLTPLKVPTSKKLKELFEEFQKRRMHLAIVLDEHGGTAGLLTMEDALEEIVGEIEDEFDEDEAQLVKKIGKSEVEATGKAPLELINETLGVQLEGPEHKTISYYITEKLGRFPKQGEILEENGVRITVDEMKKHTIKKVSVERVKGEE
jgi:CBS domain containing-hemolysin-like protein